MTRDEQRHIRAMNIVLLKEKEDELRCCRLKANDSRREEWLTRSP